jgi:hypothetical protein
VSEIPKRKQGGKGRPWPKGVSGNPSGKPSRLTKMGEELMREMFKPVDPEGLIAETASGSASDLGRRSGPKSLFCWESHAVRGIQLPVGSSVP